MFESVKDLRSSELKAAKVAFGKARDNALEQGRGAMADVYNDMMSLMAEEEELREVETRRIQGELYDDDNDFEWADNVDL